MYILYLTTNTANSKIYIGIHETENPYKFDGYLGNGIWANRPSSLLHPKTPFAYAVKKYGPKKFIRSTIKVYNTLEEAKIDRSIFVNLNFISRSDTYNTTLEEDITIRTIEDKVFQYNLEGEFIKEWKTLAEAIKFYKLNYGAIGRSIRVGQPSAGFQWSWEKVDKMKNISHTISHIIPRKVGKFDEEGNLLEEFPTVKSAQKLHAGVRQVLAGKRKHAGGYIWKYLD